MSYEMCDDFDFKEKKCLRGEDNCPYRYRDTDKNGKCKGSYFSAWLDGLVFIEEEDDDY